jgi:hypothetical protein
LNFKLTDNLQGPDYSKAPESGRSFQLLRRLSKEPTVVPRLTNPSSVFFLLSLKNFEYSWETLMLFGLKGLDTKVGIVVEKYITLIFVTGQPLERGCDSPLESGLLISGASEFDACKPNPRFQEACPKRRP